MQQQLTTILRLFDSALHTHPILLILFATRSIIFFEPPNLYYGNSAIRSHGFVSSPGFWIVGKAAVLGLDGMNPSISPRAHSRQTPWHIPGVHVPATGVIPRLAWFLCQNYIRRFTLLLSAPGFSFCFTIEGRSYRRLFAQIITCGGCRRHAEAEKYGIRVLSSREVKR